jgi:hypothetical protein
LVDLINRQKKKIKQQEEEIDYLTENCIKLSRIVEQQQQPQQLQQLHISII